ncbi:MAG: hypothetical protein ACFB4J_04280 [Elainellaceae cyanobacterium]
MKGLVSLFRSQAADTVPVTVAIDDQQSRALALQSTGLALYKQGQYDTAVPCLESALALWTVLGNFQAEQQLFQWLGSCYWNLGQAQAAYCCYQEALTLAQALKDQTLTSCSKQALHKLLTCIGAKDGQLTSH